MAQQNINIGSSANKGDGDPLRTAFTKINSNFTELYGKVTVLEGGGVAIQRDTQGSIFGDDSTLLVDAVNSLIPSSVLSGNLPALDGSALTNLTIPAQTFASLTGTPTTIVGYGISDAYTKAEVDSSIASVTAGHFDFNITGDDSTVRTVTSGSTLQITGGTAITTASDVDGNITINGVAQDFAFASLTGKPTTVAGYGITDALALGTSSTTALAGDTALFDSTTSNVAIGQSAGQTTQGADSVAIGLEAGKTTQSNIAVAIGSNAGLTNQGTESVAIGRLAGKLNQGAQTIAIGPEAGRDDQGANGIALGHEAGRADQAEYGIAIGEKSGNSNQGIRGIAIGRSSGKTDQGTKAVAIGDAAGYATQGAGAIAIGDLAGETTQATNAIAIGEKAGNVEQSIECIAIGKNAGAGAEVTATYVSGGVSGDPITMVVDDTTGIIPGMRITGTGFTYTLLEQQQKVLSVDNATTITIDAIANGGTPSGTLTFKSAQEFYSIAIGSSAGLTSQNAGAVAVGYQAGMTAQMGAVAVGSRAGEVTQGNGGVAVGVDAGRTNQGLHGIAIGKFAGNSNQSQKGIAIGYQTGETSQGEYSIAIGERAGETNQHANTIILNASSSPLNSVQTDQFIVKPIRSATMTTILGYDATSGEVMHNAAIPGYINITDLKTLVAASTDFADYQTRIAAL